MIACPPGTNEAQKLLDECKALVLRLERGQRMMEDAYQNGSLALAFDMIATYTRLSKTLIQKSEECALLHQMLLLNRTPHIKRDGRYITANQLVDHEAIEVDPWTLTSLQTLKNVFGDDIHQFLEINDSTTPLF